MQNPIKEVAEQYIFSESPWCIFTLCEKSGTVDCQSDWGNFQYRWPAHNRTSLKHFFIEMSSSHYVQDKFGYSALGRAGLNEHFDGDLNKNLLKEHILENVLDSVKQKELLELLEEVDYDNQTSVLHTMPEEIMELFGGDWLQVPCRLTPHPALTRFMQECWPRFIEALKKELKPAS